ncbi:MAG TPA: glycerophosphodiester phosphodiesterase [Thermodesulfovibrionales bacterium]|nr:glycerophosphodiester phosphodiesterase [Thermodesulfovibrionales bacterium]
MVGMFLKVGHRGARAYETENTLESFGRALALGANAVEFDIRRSGDGKLIISHDENLKRVFGMDLSVGEASLKELKDATGGRIATFEESLEFIGTRVDKILTELKESGYEKEVLARIVKKKLADRVIVTSFHEPALSSVRRLNAKIETGLIYAKFINPVEAALRLHAQYLLPLYRFVHTKDIENAHRNNLKMIVWTINTKEEAEKFMAKGVDGIATDRPDIL